MNADGSNQHQITNLGGANFGPYFTPDDKRIIFSSNYKNPQQPQLRAVPREPRRHRPRTGDRRSGVRRLSDVQPRRQEARLGVGSHGAGRRAQSVHRRLEIDRRRPSGDEVRDSVSDPTATSADNHAGSAAGSICRRVFCRFRTNVCFRRSVRGICSMPPTIHRRTAPDWAGPTACTSSSSG